MTVAQRRELVALMDYCVAHRGQIHYPPNDIRSEKVGTIADWTDIHTRVMRPSGWEVDCSQFCEALLRAVGAKLPFKDGYTGSFLEFLPTYHDGRGAMAGAVVVFGPGTGHHMAMVHTPDPTHGNPLLCSQGSDPDPRLISLTAEASGQPAGIRFCSVAKL